MWRSFRSLFGMNPMRREGEHLRNPDHSISLSLRRTLTSVTERAGQCRSSFRQAPDGRALEPEFSKQAILDFIGECQAAGFSLRAIAEDLNRQGLQTHAGSPWQHQYVASLTKKARAA